MENAEQFLAEFKAQPRWLLWRHEVRNGSKPTKVPYSVRGGLGSSTDPLTWASYPEALAAVNGFDGLGFAITAGNVLIDLDGCRDPDTATIEAWAQNIVEFLQCPAEISPSGTGLHIYVKSPNGRSLKRMFNPAGEKKKGIEVYAGGRYSAITFKHLPGTPLRIPEVDLANFLTWLERGDFDPDDRKIASVCQRWEQDDRTVRSKTLDLERWLNACHVEVLKQKPDGTRLIVCPGTHGEYDPRDGRAFVKQMASGALAMGCLHSTCSLHNDRNRWTDFRKLVERSLSPQALLAARTIVQGERELATIRLSEVTAKQQQYLWQNYLPTDQLIAIYGPSHTAKSVIALDLAARITTGSAWPDGTVNTVSPGKVLLLSAGEDALDTVLKPRFALANGDPDKLIIVQATKPIGSDLPIEQEMIALDRDIDLLKKYLENDREIRMVVVDPVTNHLGSRKLNAEEEVRPALMRLKMMAERLAVPVIIIGHLNRREKGTAALDRMLGARSFSGVPRTIFFTGTDNQSPDKHAFVLVQERGVGAPALRFHTEMVSSVIDGCETKQVRISWDATTDATAVSETEKSSEEEASIALKDFLHHRNGSAPAQDCQKYLSDSGFSTLNIRRVRRRAGIEALRPAKVGDAWRWRIPSNDLVM